MTTHAHRRLAALALPLLLTAGALGARPRVVSISPQDGEAGVDPGTRFIEVTFDQGMIDAYSWVGSGPLYPYDETRAPEWENQSTARLPIALEPDHDYQLWLNRGEYQWFRNNKGETLPSYPLRFTTRDLPELDATANAKAIDQLRALIDERYSHRDARSIDWDQEFDFQREDLLGAGNALQFAIAAAELLEIAQDVHITVKLNDFVIPTHQPDPIANFDMTQVRAEVPEVSRYTDAVVAGRFEDQTGYLLISTFDGDRREEVLGAIQAIRDMADAPAILIDVRPNAGGDETLAQEIARCFIAEPLVYAQHRWRDPEQPGGWSEPVQRVLEPRADGPIYDGPVVVIMGERNMSSCEAFLLMMRANPRARLVGQPSYGASGNPKGHTLDNGVTVMLPAWQALTPGGEPFEAVGIEPDAVVWRDLEPNRRADWFIKQARGEAETLKQRVRQMEEGIDNP